MLHISISTSVFKLILTFFVSIFCTVISERFNKVWSSATAILSNHAEIRFLKYLKHEDSSVLGRN